MSDIVEQAKAKFKNDEEQWREIYDKARDDLKFISDEKYAQWDRSDYESRVKTGRPALTVDQLGQFIHQVANDIRMNTPMIGIIPADTKAAVETAEVYKGLIREIEYHSNADDAYDTASLNSIRCGLGWLRVDFEYEDEGFDQRLVIKRVFNPLSVFIDSNSVECDGSDAKHGTVIEKITVAEFKRRFPGKNPVCFELDDVSSDKYDNGDVISIAEHYEIDEQVETITSEDGSQSRELINPVVRRYLLSGQDVLEESTFPGKFIPLIPVYGEEAWIDGKRYLFSLIRKSKDAQRRLNYWKSLETELLMKAPNAPVMAAEGQTEDYADDWKNPSKSMVLRYKMTDAEGNPAPPPQRLEPPVIPTGVVNASMQAADDIKATMGIYGAGIGQRTNETSGIAIQRRQQEGDVATFHFQDNLIRSITQLGRILVNAIPEVYSNARVIRILDIEDQPKNVGINGAFVEDQPEMIDLAQGRFEVRVKTGGTYTTRRQEAADFLSNLVNVSPDMMQIMGDLMFENMDFSGANVMAERMKKIVDPKFLDDELDPVAQAMQVQLEEMNVAMQEQQAMMASLQAELQSKQAELALKAQEIQLKQAEQQLKAAELQLKAVDEATDNQREDQKLELDAVKQQQDYLLEQQKLELERYKAEIDAQSQGDFDIQGVLNQFGESVSDKLLQVAQMSAASNMDVTREMLERMSAPKTIIRDENGEIIGVQSEQ